MNIAEGTNIFTGRKQTMSKWINCSDRLPRRFGMYLVVMDDFDNTHYLSLETYNPQDKEWSTRESMILAWMPIPEYRRK